MKLRITIAGPRVHDVGYRYFLLGGAMSLRLPGFDANNLIDGKNQITDIAIDGKESQIEAFKEFVQINRPPGAEVSSISISDYDGDVMKMAEYAQVLTLSYCSRQIFRKIIKNFQTPASLQLPS